MIMRSERKFVALSESIGDLDIDTDISDGVASLTFDGDFTFKMTGIELDALIAFLQEVRKEVGAS